MVLPVANAALKACNLLSWVVCPCLWILVCPVYRVVLGRLVRLRAWIKGLGALIVDARTAREGVVVDMAAVSSGMVIVFVTRHNECPMTIRPVGRSCGPACTGVKMVGRLLAAWSGLLEAFVLGAYSSLADSSDFVVGYAGYGSVAVDASGDAVCGA